MASTQVRLGKQKSGNTDAFGIADAIELSGHRSVRTFEALYKIPDVILSSSGNNTDNDALGQLWYVISEKKHYQLVDWTKRGKAEGWQVFNVGGDTTTLETRIALLETSYADLVKKITELEKQIEGLVPITNIALDYETMLFSGYTPQMITATITPENATEKLTWKVNDSNVFIIPSDDTLSCQVLPVQDASDGEYLLTVSSPSGLSKSVRIIFDGVEQEVVEPTVTLSGATSAKAGEEVIITASIQNAVGDGYYHWMVSGNATIKTKAEEQCTIIINDNAVEGDKITVSYEINDANGDGISFDHEITVKAKEVVDPTVTIKSEDNTNRYLAGSVVSLYATAENAVNDFFAWSVDSGSEYIDGNIEVNDAASGFCNFKIKNDAPVGTQIIILCETEGRTEPVVGSSFTVIVWDGTTKTFTLDESVLDGSDLLG